MLTEKCLRGTYEVVNKLFGREYNQDSTQTNVNVPNNEKFEAFAAMIF